MNNKVYQLVPFVRSSGSTGEYMLPVVFVLLPSAGLGIYKYGLHAALVIAVSAAASVLGELLAEGILRRQFTLTDYSALVSGLILGLILPPNVPYHYPVIAGLVSSVLAKALFGGIGKNILNPAMTGKLVLLLIFRDRMTDFSGGIFGELSPLQELAAGNTVDLRDMLLGRTAGCIGTDFAAAILIGAALLILLDVIELDIPFFYLLGFLIIWVLVGGHGWDPYYVVAQMIGGGLLFTAFFMASDYTTSPVTVVGRVFYGLLTGAITAYCRVLGMGDSACVFGLLIGNLTARFLDANTMPRPFGIRRSRRVIRYDRYDDTQDFEVRYDNTEREDLLTDGEKYGGNGDGYPERNSRGTSDVGVKNRNDSAKNRDTAVTLGLRPARMTDAGILFEWRNDPSVRAASFHTEELVYEEHVKWLENTLTRPDVSLFIMACVIDGTEYRIGQLRLNYEGPAAVVSYTIAPEFRGRGLGRELIRLGEQAAFTRNGIRVMIGEVKKDNIPSRKCFQSLGYYEELREEEYVYIKDLHPEEPADISSGGN